MKPDGETTTAPAPVPGTRRRSSRASLGDRVASVGLVLILALGFVLRYGCANHDYIALWDEAFHAQVAANLIDNPFHPVLLKDIPDSHPEADWLYQGVWVHKPPLAMWMMALSLRVFGLEEVNLRLPSVVADTLLLLVLFLILCRLSGRKTALATCLLWAACPLAIALVGAVRATDHPDVWLTVFTTLAWLCGALVHEQPGIGRRWVLFGTVFGLAVLSKGLSALLIAVAALGFLVERSVLALLRGRSLKQLLLRTMPWRGIALAWCGSMVCLPWQLYSRLRFPERTAEESLLAIRHVWKAMEGHAGDWTFHFHRLGFELVGLKGMVATSAGVILVAGALLIGFASRRPLDRLAAWWILSFYVAFTISATKMANYCTPALPAILFLWACLIGRLAGALRRIRVAVTLPAVAFAIAILALTWPLVSRSMALIERTGRDRAANRQSAFYEYRDLRHEMLQLRDSEPAKAVLWNGVEVAQAVRDRSYIQASFYSGKTAVPFALNRRSLRWSRENGFKVYLMVREGTRDRQLQEQQWVDHLHEIEFIEITKSPRRRGRETAPGPLREKIR